MENRPVPIVIALSCAVFVAHAWVAIGGGYLNYVSGIWLAMGDDLQRGVFYREIWNEHGYGGTRYFPLFFVVIGTFMRAGASPLAAGWLASGASALVLASGMYSLVRGLDARRSVAALFAAASLAPYFIQQTLFEVRADVLAAALNVWGVAFLVRGWREGAGSPSAARSASPTPSAIFFMLAVAAKVTSLAIPVAALIGAAVAGRGRLAAAIAWRLIAAIGVFFLVVQWASDGRALENWKACMFGGTNAGGTLGSLLGGDFLVLTRYSRLLTGLLAAALAAIGAALWQARAGSREDRGNVAFAATLFAGATGACAVLLSSPGTVPSNQMVEWILIVFVVLAFLGSLQPRLTRVITVGVCVLTLWASWQGVFRTRQIWADRRTEAQTADLARLVERVAQAPGPVLAENALWPVVAHREVYMLDPFALRVIMQSRPDIEQDLGAKIERRMFPMVILQVDPTSAVGRGYYENVNFGWATTQKILDNYRLESHPFGDVYVYVPR